MRSVLFSALDDSVDRILVLKQSANTSAKVSKAARVQTHQQTYSLSKTDARSASENEDLHEPPPSGTFMQLALGHCEAGGFVVVVEGLAACLFLNCAFTSCFKIKFVI